MDPSLMALILAIGVLAGAIAVGGPWRHKNSRLPVRPTGRLLATGASLALGLGFVAAGWDQEKRATERTHAVLAAANGELAAVSDQLETSRREQTAAARDVERVSLDRDRLRLMLTNAESDLDRRATLIEMGVQERSRLADELGSARQALDFAQSRAATIESENATLSENLQATDAALSGADARLVESERLREQHEQLLAVLKADRDRLKTALSVTEAALAESQAFEQVAQNKVSQLEQSVERLEDDLAQASAGRPAEPASAPVAAADDEPLETAVPVEVVTVEEADSEEGRPIEIRSAEPRWIETEELAVSEVDATGLSREVTDDAARRSIERTLFEDARARGRYAAAVSMGRSTFDALLLAQGDDEVARAAIRAFGAERTRALIAELGG